MGKVVNWVKLTIPSQSQLHFGGKDRKSCKITKFGCFDPIESTFLAKFAIVGDFEPYWCEMIQKSWKTEKNCQCTPHLTRNENFWDFPKNETLWWKKMGKVVNWVKLTIPSRLILGEKIENCAK